MAKTILIAIPTNKYIEPETFKAIYDLDIPEGYTVDFQFFYGYQIDQIRNLIAEWAKKYDYLFSVDSDMVFPKDTLSKLLLADKDIISAVYRQRKSETIIEAYMLSSRGIENIPFEALYGYKLAEIVACGMGCCLIKNSVFTNMPYPHFFYKSALDHKNTVSEDVYFCTKARDLGFSIWLDTSIRCSHIGSYRYEVPIPTILEQTFYKDMLPQEYSEYLRTLSIEPKVIYDIGSCVLHWTRKAKERWPASTYILFDATSSTLPFQKNSGHVYYNGVLCAEDNKLLDFYENIDHPGGNSYYKENTDFYTKKDVTQKLGMTLDSIVANNNWPLPDLIKLDTQGSELDILQGASKCLANATDVILEAQIVEYNLKAPKYQQILDFLEKNGFKLIKNICNTNVDGDYHFSKR